MMLYLLTFIVLLYLYLTYKILMVKSLSPEEKKTYFLSVTKVLLCYIVAISNK